MRSRSEYLNPVKARMAAHPEDYRYSSYKTIIRLQDDGITEPEKTLAYFGSKGIFGYREFVENTAHKYVVEEDGIRKVMGGSHFDLAMAIGILQQNEDIAAKNLGDYGFIGELALDGKLRACNGILPMIIAAQRKGVRKVIIPAESRRRHRHSASRYW